MKLCPQYAHGKTEYEGLPDSVFNRYKGYDLFISKHVIEQLT
jgi:hypothetical protein